MAGVSLTALGARGCVSTIRVVVRELLTFLERADKEFKPRITSEISQAAERDAPNKRWHCDTILRVLRLVHD
jgi:AP-1 complex subunit gamma-1